MNVRVVPGKRLPALASATAAGPVFTILLAIGLSHALSDLMHSLLASIHPLPELDCHPCLTQIGLLTLTLQTTASLLRPDGCVHQGCALPPAISLLTALFPNLERQRDAT